MTLAALGATPASAQDSQWIAGKWAFVWEGARDNYTGNIIIAHRRNNIFGGKLVAVKSDNSVITQDTAITVTGDEVRIECSNPSIKGWNPDRFYLKRTTIGMEGYSLDSAGQRGRKITFKRL